MLQPLSVGRSHSSSYVVALLQPLLKAKDSAAFFWLFVVRTLNKTLELDKTEKGTSILGTNELGVQCYMPIHRDIILFLLI